MIQTEAQYRFVSRNLNEIRLRATPTLVRQRIRVLLHMYSVAYAYL